LINEVLYDPMGPDSGREFVELINTGAEALPLEGWTLSAGDGARENSWRVVWTGAPGDTVAAGGLFLIGGRELTDADSHAELSLQNGPDGCALMHGRALADLLGWGAHEHGCYYEGSPAPDAASGESLSRRPDGSDSGVNADDFAPGDPTPGSKNAKPVNLVFAGGGVCATPLNPETHETVCVTVRVANTGYGHGRIDDFDLTLEIVDKAGGSITPFGNIPCSLAPGDTVAIETEWSPPQDGPLLVAANLRYEGESGVEERSSAIGVRVGPGPAVINEIMYDPEAGGEWIEIYNAGPASMSLAGWSLGDRAGGRLEFDRPPVLPAGGFVVAAQDSSSLAAAHLGLDPSIVTQSYSGRWISLNNTNSKDGLADVITLADRAGMPSDIAAYSESSGGGGVSAERLRADLVGRRPDNWFSSASGGGSTPGRSNSARIGGPGREKLLTVFPSLYPRGGVAGPALVSYNLPFRPSSLRISAYSMDGREVARLVDVSNGPVRGTIPWDAVAPGGDSLERGAYILTLTCTDGGGRSLKAKTVFAVR
jgi:hypothetical protein